jgi:hypothetical protein
MMKKIKRFFQIKNLFYTKNKFLLINQHLKLSLIKNKENLLDPSHLLLLNPVINYFIYKIPCNIFPIKMKLILLNSRLLKFFKDPILI